MPDLLRLEEVTAGYGDAVVLDRISLAVGEGESVALLGRNGVGKSTLLVTVLGLTRLHGGVVSFAGRDLRTVPTFERARAGLGWVPQDRAMFPSLTVEEHLSAVARPGPWTVARAWRLFPRLRQRRANLGNQLSGGEQQMLAIARALVLNPRLLLLDEPMEGLAPILVQELFQAIREEIVGSGMAVLLVEQHARLALQATRRAVVLERGRVVHEGESGALLADPERLRRLLAV